jgi:iron complex transport system substrate-binding protein
MNNPSTRTRMAAVLALTALALSGCGSAATTESAAPGDIYPLEVTDCVGDVTISEEPQSVLTIGMAAVALLDAAGASDKITARSGEFGAELPASLESPPSDADVIDPSDPAAEAIIGADPDVVFGYGLFNAKPDVLNQAGIEVLTVAGECGHDPSSGDSEQISFAMVTEDIRRLGTVFGTTPEAEQNADQIDAEVSDLSGSVTKDGSAAWVYYFSSSDPLSAYGATSMADAVMDAARLSNVFGDQKTSYLEVTVESLLEADPEWIVLSYGLFGESENEARRQFLAEPGVQELSAVKAGRLVLVQAAGSEPSPASVVGLKAIVTALTEAG